MTWIVKQNWGLVLASAQTILAFGACAGYALQHDWKKVAYWFFAGGITATVTWWFK